MFTQTHFLISPTGARLAYRHQLAAGKARGIIVIAHGMAEHAGRYQAFAEYLTTQNYHVYASDHRGHGHTTAPDAIKGQFAKRDGTAKIRDDLLTLRDMAANAHPDLPIILFGHSMGGIICLNMAIAAPGNFDGFAIWNCDFSTATAIPVLRIPLVMERIFKGSDVPSLLMTKFTFEAWGKSMPDYKTGYEWLTHDPAEVADYVADPLSGFECTVSLWLDVLDLIKTGGAKSRLSQIPHDKPIHLLGGGQDPASNKGKAVTWLEKRMINLGMTDITKIIYPQARHETLHDTDKDQAMADFADWANRICPQAQ